MVIRARRECTARNVNFLAADAHDLPFIDGCADHVLALGLFAYVKDPVSVFREFYRVVRQDGLVMITNSVSHLKEKHRAAGVEAGLTLMDEAEGYSPATSGDIKRGYLLVFAKPCS